MFGHLHKDQGENAKDGSHLGAGRGEFKLPGMGLIGYGTEAGIVDGIQKRLQG
jgi:hypothetical protein